jgi:hypothetical protein
MSERERLIIILAGVVLSFVTTGAVIWLAVLVESERTLIVGALVGTGAFGGGALFGLLGAHRPAQTTINAEPPSTVSVNEAPAAEGRQRP